MDNLQYEYERLKRLVDFFREREEQHLLLIDELSRENQQLRDWKAKWEERYNAD